MLCVAGAIREPILYLSLYFKTNRQKYYELLDRVRSHGDWETWLEFFLTGVKETAQQAADTSKEILTLIEEDRRKIEELGHPAASVLRVHQHVQRKPIITIPATAEQLSLSGPTVAKALQHMVKLNMVRETTGKQRHRSSRITVTWAFSIRVRDFQKHGSDDVWEAGYEPCGYGIRMGRCSVRRIVNQWGEIGTSVGNPEVIAGTV